MLTVQETSELLKAAKNGDDAAKMRLVDANSPLIKSIVRRYLGKGVEYDDLYQLGCLGIIKAITKYNADYGVKFTTYAVPLISGEIKRFLRDDGSIKVSRSVKGLYIKIKRLLAVYQCEATSPTVDILAKELAVTREEVIFAMEASHMPISMFETGGTEGLSIGEKLVGADDANLVDNIVLQKLLDSLDERGRKIIALRYFRNFTQSETAKQLGISQVQVSRIEQRTLASFREFFKRGEDAG